MNNPLFIGTCHLCDKACVGAGRIQCSIDGLDIVDHAERAACPHPSGSRFGRVDVAVEYLRMPAARIDPNYDPANLEHRDAGKCGC